MSQTLPEHAMHVINSNDINLLAFYCSYIIKNIQIEDSSPFDTEKVIVMNKGMKSYLQHRIADYADVCSGVEFNQLWEFIWGLHKDLNYGDEFNRFNHEHLTWALFKSRDQWGTTTDDNDEDELSDKNLFSSMRSYLNAVDKNSDDTSKDDDGAHVYQLCGVIADALDQYQMYRPDWISIWNKYEKRDPLSFRKVVTEWLNYVLKTKNSLSYEDIKNWKGDKSPLVATLQKNLWQIRLWTIIKDNLPSKAKANEVLCLDRAAVISTLIEKITENKNNPEFRDKLPKRVFLFGVTSLPSQVIYLLSVLGKVIPVFFMNLNPCREYWGDLLSEKSGWRAEKNKIYKYLKALSLPVPDLLPNDVKLVTKQDKTEEEYFKTYDSFFENETYNLIDGNPILVASGKEGRDTLNELFSIDSTDSPIDFSNIFVQNVQEDDENSKTLLNYIKDDLLNLEERKDKIKIDPHDRSVQIRSCHTIRREVEVLRDEILSIVKLSNDKEKYKDNKLSIFSDASEPYRILVMVPNIEKYAPYIESVFGSERNDDNNLYIPYVICDKSAKESNNVADAVLKLLSIGNRKITVRTVVDLLSIEPLAKKFDISSDDIAVISSWFKQTGVHWGLDGRDVEEELGDNVKLPWTVEDGLLRLVNGYIEGDLYNSPGFSDIDSADYELLNKLCSFIEKLKTVRNEFDPYASEDKTNNWSKKLDDLILKGFFVEDEETKSQCDFIRGILDEMYEAITNLSDKDEFSDDQDSVADFKIKLPVFMAKLEHAFGNSKDSSQYLRGKLNFCSLMPMRAVPFDHIFILGLNDLDFPRNDNVPSFNLLGIPGLFRRNDRSRVNDDRFIFLEAILSAQKSLYLSYIGQSPVNNTEMNPSLVLKEFDDYIYDHFSVDAVGDDNIKNHYFSKEKLNSYDPENFRKRKEDSNNYLKIFSSFNKEFYLDIPEKISDKKKKPLGYLGEGENPLNQEIPDTISFNISELVRFFKDPCKKFLKDNLHIYLDIKAGNDVSDIEPFTLSILDKGNLLENIESNLNESTNSLSDIENMLNVQAQKGLLPASVFLEENNKEISQSALKMYENLKTSVDNHSGKHYKYSFTQHIAGKDINLVFEGILPVHSNLIFNYYSTHMASKFSGASVTCHVHYRLIEALLRYVAYAHITDGVQQNQIISVLNKEGNREDIIFGDDFDLDGVFKSLVNIYLQGKLIPLPFDKKTFETVESAFRKGNFQDLDEYLSSSDNVSLLDSESALYLFNEKNIFDKEANKISECQYSTLTTLLDTYLNTIVKAFGENSLYK